MIQRAQLIKPLALVCLLGLAFLSTLGFSQTAPTQADVVSPASGARLQTEDANAAPNQAVFILGTTSKRVGESTVIHLDLSAPFVGNVPSFALASPPRLVVDLPNVAHRGAKGLADLGVGDIRSATIAQSGARSRMVLNLVRSVPYVVFAEGSRVVVVINPPQGKTFPINSVADAAVSKPDATGASTVLAPAANAVVPAAPGAQTSAAAPVAPVRTMPVAVQREVKSIDFRRGEDGAGRVVIDLSDGSTAIDVRQVGATLVVDVERANLPPALRRRLDVTDFATPVQRVSSLQQGSSTRVLIEPKGAWEHSAYQADNRLVVEVRGIKEDPNKLVQGSKSGYKGDKLSLNFQNIDIRSLLQVFADFTNFNIITSDTVQGTVTLRLKDVPWDQALDIVMQSKGLDSRKNGNVVLIAPRDELAAKEKLELEQKSQIANLEPVKSEVFQLQYQKAEDIKKMITENSGGSGGDAKATSTRFLSARGSAGADTRTNQLFVTDTPTKLDEVRKLLGKVDIPIRQVLIEARIVEASDTFSKSLGVKLGFNDRRITQGTVGGQIAGNNYATFSGTQQGVADLTGQGGVTTGTSLGNTNFVNLPALAAGTNAPASFALSLFGSGLTRFINLELSALEADNKGKIISSPRLVTSDATKAVIESGTEIPYASTSSSGTNISFKKAVLKLEVTPQITPEGNVILDLQINKDSRGEATAAGPSIDTRNIKTQVLVENGGTVVVGGVYLQEEANQTNKVPLLGDLPFIGAFFRNNQRINNKTELLIFITPKVVVSNALSVSNAGK